MSTHTDRSVCRKSSGINGHGMRLNQVNFTVAPYNYRREAWQIEIPDQTGTFAVVTGGNSGIGLETARSLAIAGAEVVLAVRNAEKGATAADDLRSTAPHATVSVGALDLASLLSIERFAKEMLEQGRPIDLLVNNAGIMAVPKRRTTEDGFELQFGTNHLGHFALTGRLLPLLRDADHPRVVTVSSGAHLMGSIPFDDLNLERGYRAWKAYSESKLANLLFASELQRRSVRNGWGILSNAAHPGSTRTNLQTTGPNMGKESRSTNLIELPMRLPGMSQDAAHGALPTLFAATSPDAVGDGYYGPSGFLEMTGGGVTTARRSKRARSEADATRLWTISEELTGVRFA